MRSETKLPFSEESSLHETEDYSKEVMDKEQGRGGLTLRTWTRCFQFSS